MAYLVLAYPELSNDNYKKIQSFRKDNDELFFNLVDPHFTFVFPICLITEEDFINEVKYLLADHNSFDFTIRCATVNKDAFNDYYHVLLVPDEGYSKIVKLHDLLYSNLFRNELKLDIDFIPHIGIANSIDPINCKQWVDEWNSKPFEIKGTINKLNIIEYTGDSIKEVHSLLLR